MWYPLIVFVRYSFYIFFDIVDIGECYLAAGNPSIAEECVRAAIAHYQEQQAARTKAITQGHAHAHAQDRWQSADPTQEQYARAVELLENIRR
jgi:hypothetical protein